MEDSSMNASPTKGVERVVAAKEARERETKEPCPMETAESRLIIGLETRKTGLPAPERSKLSC